MLECSKCGGSVPERPNPAQRRYAGQSERTSEMADTRDRVGWQIKKNPKKKMQNSMSLAEFTQRDVNIELRL